MYQLTTATKKISAMTQRLRAIPGGTSASKTISILLYLIARAQSDKEATLTSIVAESIPALKKGALRDFKKILKAHNYWKGDRWHETDKIYTFETGSQIEFFGADQAEKLRGGRRDRLFINECNNVKFEAFEELEVRTKEFVFLDWNPTNEFWYYTNVKVSRNDIEELTLTYKDNESLDPRIIESIEQRMSRKGWWLVYGLGQLGEVEGRIFTGWEIVDDIPQGAKLISRGLDFGYTNDPTAIIDIYSFNDSFVLDEICYKKGLRNSQIADILLATEESVLVYADGAEPKSIDEIASYGIPIVAAPKGPGSVNQGIDFVQGQKILVTKRSVNTIKEYRNYLWAVDRQGKVLNVPIDLWNHCMDALRYGLSAKRLRQKELASPVEAGEDFLKELAAMGNGFKF